ncbi:phenylacetate--CoA ligase family protein [Psychrobium sp. 1_MG-2023]|uniref:phenylacetate--CoA ligase family protein n=1 Tax=Psychrobium sp. 1_MG-2023 TaxID=3062624 RepID=UPI0026B78014|nr:AMP-binding protein [Psychrobium sp. 1_MG-2023]MDP2561116.1 AMP-binding protein [Psychrobium sp. 1_MG-2023]
MTQSLYTSLVSKVIFPLHESLKSHHSVSVRQSLERSQWQSKQQIFAERDQRLARFIDKVYNDVPYINQLFNDLCLTPEDVCQSDELTKLPFMTKEVIKQNFDELISVNAGPLSKGNTGGSSGSPLTFMLGKNRVSHDVAQKWRATRWWGVDIGDKELVAWGSPIELGAQDKVRQWRDGLLRTELMPAFDLTERSIEQFIHRIVFRKPAMLFGYPSVYEVIAKQARMKKVRLDNLGIEVIFVTSERLYDHQRELIESVFGCPVANGYGGRDAGFIAHECSRGGMHLSAEDIIVEIVDSAGNPLPDGESGEIVITHLASEDFPFIRYRTGDIGCLSTANCPCGRGLPMLESIEGRSTDFVIAQDGTMMHGLALIYILREIEGIKEFKVVQQSIDLTDVFIVPEQGGLSDAMSSAITQGFKARLGQGVEINIQLSEAIVAEKSGKYRYIISHAID